VEAVQPIISVRDLWFAYEKADYILKGVSFDITSGELIAIIGHNGSGKTTLVKHFNGLLKPTKGSVFINGINTKQATVAELARNVSYVFQNPNHQIFADTVYEEVAFGPRNLGYDEERVHELVESSLRVTGLDGTENTPPFTLSMGARERLAIASIIAMDPKVLVFDEPTTGQDHKTCLEVMEIIRKCSREGKTIVLISHDMELVAEWVNRVIVMADGVILLDGSTREVFSKQEVLNCAKLKPPQVIQVAWKLGLQDIPLTVDELVTIISRDLP
jgi:energy-coupling factor transport system ATP-binding protein